FFNNSSKPDSWETRTAKVSIAPTAKPPDLSPIQRFSNIFTPNPTSHSNPTPIPPNTSTATCRRKPHSVWRKESRQPPPILSWQWCSALVTLLSVAFCRDGNYTHPPTKITLP